jgi:hypothetical protein
MTAAWRVRHLVTRFFTSLRSRPLDAAELAFVDRVLEPKERRVWDSLGPADRRESVDVACRTEAALASTPYAGDVRFLAAALAHDVGKAGARLGPVGRAVATVVAALTPDRRLDAWRGRSGWRRRVAIYAGHADVGADALRTAGARPEVVAWAAAHHRPDRWPALPIPVDVCAVLARADGEFPPC